MICSVIFDTFLPKKKSLSFPKNLEQSRSIEHREGCTKWGEVQKKKGGWFYRRATKGNDGRLSLVQGSLIEGETSSNLDETRRFLLRLLPPPPPYRRGHRQSRMWIAVTTHGEERIPDSERGIAQSSLPCSSNTILINRFFVRFPLIFLPPSCGGFNSSLWFWRIYLY